MSTRRQFMQRVACGLAALSAPSVAAAGNKHFRRVTIRPAGPAPLAALAGNISGTVSAVYNDPMLSDPYANPGAANTVVCLHMSPVNAALLRPNDILAITGGNPNHRSVCVETAQVFVLGDLTSYAECSLLEADTDAILAGVPLYFRIIGGCLMEPDPGAAQRSSA